LTKLAEPQDDAGTLAPAAAGPGAAADADLPAVTAAGSAEDLDDAALAEYAGPTRAVCVADAGRATEPVEVEWSAAMVAPPAQRWSTLNQVMRKVNEESEVLELVQAFIVAEKAEVAEEAKENVEAVRNFENEQAAKKAEEEAAALQAMPELERAIAAARSAEADERSSKMAVDVVDAGSLCKIYNLVIQSSLISYSHFTIMEHFMIM